MPNVVVSQDVDTLLTKSSKTEVLSYLGISDNTSNIADNTSNIATNTSNIATNTSDISANTAQIALQDGYLYVNSSNIATNTADIATNTANIATNATNIATKQDILTFGIANTNAVKIDNTNSPANSGDICKFAGSGIMPYKYANLKYDLGVDLKAPIASPSFTGNASFNNDVSIDGELAVESTSNFNGEVSISGTLECQDDVTVTNGGIELQDGGLELTGGGDVELTEQGKIKVGDDLEITKDTIIFDGGDLTLDAPEVVITSNASVGGDFSVGGDHTINTGKLIAREIQCEGGTSSTALPINYDSNEHRFRDYDASPTDLMVIEKIDGYTGARVGINKDPSASNAVALHVVAGKNGSTNVKDLGLKVVGGSFFEDFIRVGHYTDTTRGQISNPTNGTIIYNSQHHEFQGYVGGGTGWQKFNMGAVSS